MHPDCIFGVRLVGLLGRLRLQGPLRWTSTHGHPVACLHTWLLDRGWTLLRPFVWKCEASNDLLDLHDPAWDVRLLPHAARSVRVGVLGACASMRWPNGMTRIVLTWSLLPPSVRLMLIRSGPGLFRALRPGLSRLVLLSVLSCCRAGREFLAVACGDWGTWDHCAWSCSDRPGVELLPGRPAHQLTSRYGWKIGFVPNIDQIQAWLVQVQSRMWEVNHPRPADAP